MEIMQLTVNEVLRLAPQAAGILNRLGIDTCCGGSLTLTEAVASIGLSPQELRAALEPALKEMA